MEDLVERTVDQLRHRGVAYGDVRVETITEENIFYRNRRLAEVTFEVTEGVGVRAVMNGCWGFASCTGFDPEDVEETVGRAVDIARSASGGVRGDLVLAEQEPVSGVYRGPCLRDPFSVPREEKIGLLDAAAGEMMSSDAIRLSWGWLWTERRQRHFGNTEGSLVSSDIHFCQPTLNAYAVDGDEAQSRTLQVGARAAGWEWIEETDIPFWAAKVREEAIMKVKAGDGPEGRMDLVLDGLNLSLTMHESVGHPTESDRVLGWEANWAGRSFLEPGDEGRLRYGSDRVSFLADNTLPYGLATWGWDDDGVPGQKWYLVKDGIFQEFGSVRETAPLIGRKHSRGCCRAQDSASFPINRQPNFYLEPSGDGTTPDDLIAGVDRGIFIEGRGSFSIDQRRINFQFGGDMFWEIRNGRKTKPLKKVIYRSTTQEFWGSCDGVSDAAYFTPMGLLNCGKGEPSQAARMTHGASPARFRNVEVGGGV
jgi:TldD protein